MDKQTVLVCENSGFADYLHLYIPIEEYQSKVSLSYAHDELTRLFNEYDIDMVALMCMPAQQEDIKAHIRKIAPDVTILEGDNLNGLFN